MKTFITLSAYIFITFIAICCSQETNAQTCEWRLINQNYSSVDPDGAGPATGSASFTLQIRATSGTIPSVGVITTGFSFQSTKAMVPTTPGCAIVTSPANISVSSGYTAGGYLYETVNQCNIVSVTTGAQLFDRTAAGTLNSSGTGITLTTTFSDAFTVTLWTLGSSFPQGGYVMINSGSGGSPGGIGSYGVFDNFGGDFITNSLTYSTPLALGGTVPVLFSKFEAKCTNTGTMISWATSQEGNSSRFEVERSINGTLWTKVGTISAIGNSSRENNYQQLDLNSGTAMYRIKQIDKDGAYIYTGVERTNCMVKNITSLIYPVPAYDVLNVVIRSDKSIRTQLSVYDMQGKVVRKVDAAVLSGNNTFKINLLGLTPGDYMLRTNDSRIEINKIFTISR